VEPLLAVGFGGERCGGERFEVVGDVVERVAFVEVVDGAVGADVLLYLGVKGLRGAGDECGVSSEVRTEGGELDAMTVPVVDVSAGVVVFPVKIAGGHGAEELNDLLLRGRGKAGTSEIEGEDDGVEAGLVDGVEAGLVELRPCGEEAAFRVEVAGVAGEAVGEGEGEHGVEVALGLDALVADSLVREGAFGVEASEWVRGVGEMDVRFVDEVLGERRLALGGECGGKCWRDKSEGLVVGWLGSGLSDCGNESDKAEKGEARWHETHAMVDGCDEEKASHTEKEVRCVVLLWFRCYQCCNMLE